MREEEARPWQPSDGFRVPDLPEEAQETRITLWHPLEPTEWDRAWIERQRQFYDELLRMFGISPEMLFTEDVPGSYSPKRVVRGRDDVGGNQAQTAVE